MSQVVDQLMSVHSEKLESVLTDDFNAYKNSMLMSAL